MHEQNAPYPESVFNGRYTDKTALFRRKNKPESKPISKFVQVLISLRGSGLLTGFVYLNDCTLLQQLTIRK